MDIQTECKEMLRKAYETDQWEFPESPMDVWELHM